MPRFLCDHCRSPLTGPVAKVKVPLPVPMSEIPGVRTRPARMPRGTYALNLRRSRGRHPASGLLHPEPGDLGSVCGLPFLLRRLIAGPGKAEPVDLRCRLAQVRRSVCACRTTRWRRWRRRSSPRARSGPGRGVRRRGGRVSGSQALSGNDSTHAAGAGLGRNFRALRSSLPRLGPRVALAQRERHPCLSATVSRCRSRQGAVGGALWATARPPSDRIEGRVPEAQFKTFRCRGIYSPALIHFLRSDGQGGSMHRPSCS